VLAVTLELHIKSYTRELQGKNRRINAITKLDTSKANVATTKATDIKWQAWTH